MNYEELYQYLYGKFWYLSLIRYPTEVQDATWELRVHYHYGCILDGEDGGRIDAVVI